MRVRVSEGVQVMAYFRDRDSSPTVNSARKLIPLGGAHAWPFVSCRRYLPWFYSVLLLRGRQPLMSLPVPPPEMPRPQPGRGIATEVRMKQRSSV